MESLSRTIFTTNSETYPILNNIPSSSFKLHNTKPTGSLKFAETPHFSSLRLQALERDVSGDADDQGPFTNNGFGFFSDDILSLPQVVFSLHSETKCFIPCLYESFVYFGFDFIVFARLNEIVNVEFYVREFDDFYPPSGFGKLGFLLLRLKRN